MASYICRTLGPWKKLSMVFPYTSNEQLENKIVQNTKPNYILSTWAGPQAIPTMCLVSSPGSAAGSGLVTRKVSKCWHWSLLPQLCTSLSSVRARQWVEPAATSITFFPMRKEGDSCSLKPVASGAKKISEPSYWDQKALIINFFRIISFIFNIF